MLIKLSDLSLTIWSELLDTAFYLKLQASNKHFKKKSHIKFCIKKIEFFLSKNCWHEDLSIDFWKKNQNWTSKLANTDC